MGDGEGVEVMERDGVDEEVEVMGTREEGDKEGVEVRGKGGGGHRGGGN